jgi:regulatory protein
MTKISLKSRAIKYLSLREHSIKEIKLKLSPYANDRQELNQIINWLIENNYLSEDRYIESFIVAKSKKYGLLKVKYLLEQKVEDKTLLINKLKSYKIDQVDVICQLWQKKYGDINENINLDIQQKAIKWLINKGFSYTLIKQAIKILQND